MRITSHFNIGTGEFCSFLVFDTSDHAQVAFAVYSQTRYQTGT
jgi:hypothetical protein